MKYINLLFAILFLVSALLQLNDPDPLLWALIYFSGAFLCFTAVRGIMKKWIFITALIFYLTFAVYLFIIQDGVLDWVQEHQAEGIIENMSDEKPWIERTREFFGLLILAAAVALNLLFPNSNKGLRNASEN